MAITRIFRDILSGVDNHSIEAGRVLWVFGAASFIISTIVFQAIALWKGQAFSPIEFSTGFGGGLAAVLAAGGVGIAQKDKALAATTNPQPDAGTLTVDGKVSIG